MTGKNLRCHYCGHLEVAPDVCPKCSGLDILYKGFGTQKVEQELVEQFANARVLRMDQDVTTRKNSHEEILENFRSGKSDILIGTKMISKGLDFERVSLVGIISADQGLSFPDFRSSEKVFQLLTQAAGRAGRGASSGEVVIQTFDPKHYIFKFLYTHNYLKFYEKELENRKLLNYPPFSRLCLIRVVGEKESDVEKYSQAIVKFLWSANSERKFQILGPAPAPFFKLNNKYRYHILLKQKREIDPSMNYIRQLLKKRLYKQKEFQKWPVQIQIDVDPVEIM
jgi:primosomal protein N' (replication factor Y)